MLSPQRLLQVIHLYIGLVLLLLIAVTTLLHEDFAVESKVLTDNTLITESDAKEVAEPTCSMSAQRDRDLLFMTRSCTDGYSLTKAVTPENDLVFWVDHESVLGYRIEEHRGRIKVSIF